MQLSLQTDTICCFHDKQKNILLPSCDEVTGVRITLPETCETAQYVPVALPVCILHLMHMYLLSYLNISCIRDVLSYMWMLVRQPA